MFKIQPAKILCAIALLISSYAKASFEEELLGAVRSGDSLGAYQWVLSVESRFSGQPGYYDWLSRYAMGNADYAVAVDALQKLISLSPNHMGGRLDLVIALQLDGRTREARQQLMTLNRLLSNETQLPEMAQRQLEELNLLFLSQEAGVKVGKKKVIGLLTMAYGYDDNVNQGSDHNTLKTELPGGFPLEIALGPDSLPISDRFLEVGLQFQFNRQKNGCKQNCTRWLAGASYRDYEVASDYNQRQLFVGANWRYAGKYRPELTLMLRNSVAADLEFDQAEEQNNIALHYYQQLPYLSGSSVLLSAEVIHESHQNNSISYRVSGLVDGDFAWAQQGSPFNIEGVRWFVAANWHERPSYSSGDVRAVRAGVEYAWPVAESWQLDLSFSGYQRKEVDPFNELFFGSRVRKDEALQSLIRLEKALSDTFVVKATAKYEKITSNISLYDVNRFQLMLSFEYLF